MIKFVQFIIESLKEVHIFPLNSLLLIKSYYHAKTISEICIRYKDSSRTDYEIILKVPDSTLADNLLSITDAIERFQKSNEIILTISIEAGDLDVKQNIH